MQEQNHKRRVLVTGASRGIGRAVAIKLAASGFLVSVHYGHDAQAAAQTLELIESEGGTGSLLCFDVSCRAQCKEVLESELAAHGPYYGLVLNAGVARDGAFPGMAPEEWDTVLRTDLDSFYNVLNPCLMPLIRLRQGGRIIAMSSVSGVMGNRGQVNYSAAKAGLIGAVKALAVELASRKITVNAVAPGLIDTEMTQLPEDILHKALDLIPMKRMGTPEEVASLVDYLMSDQAAYLTRQCISINGGML